MAKANPVDGAKELQQMLVAYVKQETVEPLKTLGGYLAWGIAGAIFIFLGVMFLALGTLRFFQSEFTTFEGGGWQSAGPYGIALGILVVLIALVLLAFQRAKKAIL